MGRGKNGENGGMRRRGGGGSGEVECLVPVAGVCVCKRAGKGRRVRGVMQCGGSVVVVGMVAGQAKAKR